MKEVRVDLSSNLLAAELIRSHAVFSEYNQIYNKKSPGIKFVNDKDGIPIFNFNRTNKIKNHNSKIVIVDLLTESLNVSKELLELAGTDKTYILFSNGQWEEGLFPFKHRVITDYYFLHNWALQLAHFTNVNYYVDAEYKFPASSRYLFCALIGSARPPRDFIVSQLISKVCQNFSLSYHGNQLVGERIDEISYNFDEFNSYEGFPNISSFFNISSSIPTNLFNSCQFNLIVETSQDIHGDFHLTEKTLKALAFGIPFVMAGTHLFLKNLRDLGFRTFDELWSEQYDEISNFENRMDSIVTLINDLQNFDWGSAKSKLAEIANHNRLHLMKNSSRLRKDTLLRLEEVFDEHC